MGLATAVGALAACATSLERDEHAAPMAVAADEVATNRSAAETVTAPRSAEASEVGDAPPPVPPGVDPAALRLRSDDDSFAWRTLESMLPPEPFLDRLEPRPAVDPEEAASARERAREALEAGRALIAVNELEKALRHDEDSIDGLRLLARALGAAGGSTRGFDAYLRLLSLEPEDPEALFSVAMALVNQRAFSSALPPLLSLRHALDADPASVVEDLGDEASLVIGHVLSVALRQVGHDRASIDAAQPALAVNSLPAAESPGPLRRRAEEVLRQRSDLLKAIGDAWCRLGEPARALEAYRRIGSVDPVGQTALLARRLYVLSWLGEDRAARDEFIGRIAADPSRITRQEAALAGWLAAGSADPRPLAAALRRLADSTPEQPALLWVAAGAAPTDEAVPMLRAYLAARPRDLPVIAELLHGLALQRLDLAVALAIELVQANPIDVEPVVERLVAAAPDAKRLRSALDAAPPTVARDVTFAWTLALLRDPGRAWTEIDAAIGRDPSSPTLHSCRVAIAGLLEELTLVDEAVAAARSAGAWSPLAAMAEVEARLRCRQWARAEEVAADLLFERPDDADALALAATASLVHAVSLAPGTALRTAAAEDARRSADAALTIDPTRHRAWETLIRLHDPRGGLLPDAAIFQEVIGRLQAIDREHPLLLRMIAMEEIGRGRLEQAIEGLVALWERQPADDDLVRILLQAWSRQNRAMDAEAWFRARLAESPASPRLADAVVTAMVQRGAVAEAEAMLRDRIAADGDDAVALWLLETVLRNAGSSQAAELAAARLERRPSGPRRSIELASLAIERGDADGALVWLETLLARPERLSSEQLAVALTVTEQLPAGERVDVLQFTFAVAALDQVTDAPSIVHGLAILSAARLESERPEIIRATGRSLDGLIDGFARSSAGRAAGAESFSQWALLTQRLVDSGRAGAAVRAVRRRLDDAILQDDATAVAIASLAVTADIAVGDPASARRTLMLLADHQERLGWPPQTRESGLPEAGPMPSDPRLRRLADVIFWASGRWSILGRSAEAKVLLEEALRLDGEHAMAKNNLGYARLEAAQAARTRPDPETATLIEGAHRALPDDPSIIDSIGWLRYLQGHVEDDERGPGAVTLLLEALERTGEDPSVEILDHCGDALWRVGRREEATALWQAGAITLDRDHPIERSVSQLATLMSREFGIVIDSPQDVHDRLYGRLLRQLQAKLDAVSAGEAPSIAEIVGAD